MTNWLMLLAPVMQVGEAACGTACRTCRMVMDGVDCAGSEDAARRSVMPTR